jgi:hypothetical protein
MVWVDSGGTLAQKGGAMGRADTPRGRRHRANLGQSSQGPAGMLHRPKARLRRVLVGYGRD